MSNTAKVEYNVVVDPPTKTAFRTTVMTRLIFSRTSAFFAFASLLFSVPSGFAQWPDRHGPTHDGVVAGPDARRGAGAAGSGGAAPRR